MALTTKGLVKVCVFTTSPLLNTPTAAATNPLIMVAEPKIPLKSGDDTPAVCAAETNHESKQENKIEVEIPPKTRPIRLMGSQLTKVQKQVAT